MVVRPNNFDDLLSRGYESGLLSVTRMLDGVPLWVGEMAHKGAITVLCWSPDGQRLASGGMDGMVRVWDKNTGKLIEVLDHDAPVQHLRWSRQGMLASSSADGIIHLWQLGPAVADSAAAA